MMRRKKAPSVEVVGEKSPTIQLAALIEEVESEKVSAPPADNYRRFSYIGNCASGFIVMFGLTFRGNTPVRVKDGDIAEKLAKHSHFKEVL